MAFEKAGVVLYRYRKTLVSHCYVKRAGYAILYHEAVFMKKKIFKLYICV